MLAITLSQAKRRIVDRRGVALRSGGFVCNTEFLAVLLGGVGQECGERSRWFSQERNARNVYPIRQWQRHTDVTVAVGWEKVLHNV